MASPNTLTLRHSVHSLTFNQMLSIAKFKNKMTASGAVYSNTSDGITRVDVGRPNRLLQGKDRVWDRRNNSN